MRILIFVLLFFGCISPALSQNSKRNIVENIILHIPQNLTNSTAGIAGFINENFTLQSDKVLAVYTWITNNIRYDTDSANNINLGVNPLAKIYSALRRKKGVCENYAAIFNDIILQCGIKSFVVDGYTKQNGSIDKTGHAWCAVLIDTNWFLCDPTWDVGGNTEYYLQPPGEMIASHIPYDLMWQLLNFPVSHQNFYEGNIYQTKNLAFFNYKDSINAFIKMDSLQKFTSTAAHIEQNGLYNKLVKQRLDYNKMQIEIIRQDKDVNLYDSAVANLNGAMNIYNTFIQYRNKQFIPLIPDKNLSKLLAGIEAKLLNAFKQLEEINRTEATFTFSTEVVRDKINALSKRVQEQEQFIKHYINTPAANRQTLFYNEVTQAAK